ncbi:cytochrome c [uncultured Propionivibrio sp.]|uniref:c-type cytochrome n=1 Tax=uncultured Propionivibrio sp. TaxID=426737 RepID=UPI0029BFEA25|nr:cytochrome c [uncultured Propionivibrio sp.]
MIRNSAFALLITLSTSLYAAQPGDTTPDLAKAKSTAESICVACHSADGNSTISANPILAGQHREYLLKQLTEFKSVDGKPQVRNNAVMLGMTATLSGDDMRGLASYFSQQKVKPAKATDPKLVAAGKILWRRGDPDKGIPACAGCHGPAGAGLPVQYPRLAGQHAEYTETQLKNFRSEERSNDPERMMRTIADKLSDKQIKALADYIAGLRG